MKRFLVVTGIVVGIVVLMVVLISIGYENTDTDDKHREATGCLHDQRDFLAAQSVPSAQYVPCFTERAVGWTVAAQSFSNDGAHVSLSTEAIQDVEWTVDFTAACQPPSTTPVAKPGNPAQVHQRTDDRPDVEGVERTEWMTFTGGCVVSKVVVPGRIDQQYIFEEVDDLMRLVPRSALDEHIRKETDGKVPLDPPSSSAAPPTTGTNPATTVPRSGRSATTTRPSARPDDTARDEGGVDDTGADDSGVDDPDGG